MKHHSFEIIQIPNDAKAIVKSRPNRYLAIVDIIHPESQNNVSAHVHDPGRLTDLLFSGNEVVLKYVASAQRKTKWDIIAAKNNENWVLIHSGYHRRIVEAILNNPQLCPFGKMIDIKPEVTYEHSRLDFLIKNKANNEIWIEVKGCTLAIDGIALFPDAPTKRGCKHLETLIQLRQAGMYASIMILIFRPEAKYFSPHTEIDPAFSKLFFKALDVGVEVHPILLSYQNEKIFFRKRINVRLQESV